MCLDYTMDGVVDSLVIRVVANKNYRILQHNFFSIFTLCQWKKCYQDLRKQSSSVTIHWHLSISFVFSFASTLLFFPCFISVSIKVVRIFFYLFCYFFHLSCWHFIFHVTKLLISFPPPMSIPILHPVSEPDFLPCICVEIHNSNG